MPGVERLSVDEIVRAAEQAAKLTIPCIALFPYTDPGLRDEDGSEALNPDNLVCRAIRAIKKAVPEIGVLCDVALDPYTSHGHDGLMRDGVILNDETVAVLVQAGAGAGRGRLRHHRAVRHDGRPRRRDPQRASTRRISSTCRSWPTRRNTLRRSTARSATRSARRRRSSATSAPIRWTPATPTRRCARPSSTSPKAPT